MKNTIKCDNCKITLKADNSTLGILGGFGGLFAGIFIIWNKSIFGNNSSSFLLGLACSLLVLIIVAFIQNQTIKFQILDISIEPIEISDDFENFNLNDSLDYERVIALKRHYKGKTDSELEEISKDDRMTDEAKKAALELLEEKINIT